MIQKHKIAIVLAITGALVVTASVVSAQIPSTTDLIKQLEQQIQTLKAQIENLKAKEAAIKEARMEVKETVQDVRGTLKLLRHLRKGMSGDDVKELQEILASDPDIYPEGFLTGFFGALTEKAVKKFQKKHGIEDVGEVGPKTLARIKKFFEEGAGGSGKIPPGLLKKLATHATSTPDDDDDKDDDDDANKHQGRGKEKIIICHIPPGNPNAKQTLTVAEPALKAHLAHGDTRGTCQGGTGTTTPPTPPPPPPDTTAPIISSISATSTTSSTTKIVWTTNESSNSKVWYNTISPVNTSATTTPMVSALSLVTSHELSLSGLSASTTYYYIVSSADATGNIATSSESVFTIPLP